ncbi:MAG: hypothetical protein NW220_10435 [Leptolyngbyaceae cyanobacterium bins.349]|nr:hypothetical protein [Leptolyngbyaceae cyanobacterium bins.349]
MAGKLIKDIKLQGFPAIAAIVSSLILLTGIWVFLGRLFSSETRLATVPLIDSPQELAELPASSRQVPAPPANSESAQNAPVTEPNRATSNSARQGVLRVANPSDHPVRVALLLKKSDAAKSAANTGKNYEPPAHWDFAPGEGRTKGLLLSLPNRSLKVKPGDVLVAFAQDGSRRYWGPYVVGETVIPNWSAGSSEWQLVLDP